MSLLLLLAGGTVVSPNADGTWTEAPAAWSATGLVVQDVTATGTWLEAAAAWSATASTSVVEERPRGRTVKFKRRVLSFGEWEQAPGAWGAVATVRRPRRPDDDELLLLDVV